MKIKDGTREKPIELESTAPDSKRRAGTGTKITYPGHEEEYKFQ